MLLYSCLVAQKLNASAQDAAVLWAECSLRTQFNGQDGTHSRWIRHLKDCMIRMIDTGGISSIRDVLLKRFHSTNDCFA